MDRYTFVPRTGWTRTKTGIPERFAVKFECHDYQGIRHYQQRIEYHRATGSWQMQTFKNGICTMIDSDLNHQLVENYYQWGIDKNPKTGLDYRNIQLIEG